jgi:hypothetical protein
MMEMKTMVSAAPKSNGFESLNKQDLIKLLLTQLAKPDIEA